jgi:hypothetical protein
MILHENLNRASGDAQSLQEGYTTCGQQRIAKAKAIGPQDVLATLLGNVRSGDRQSILVSWRILVRASPSFQP